MNMLSDDAFARLVAEDVKNRVTQSQADYLRMEENWPRWRRALELLLSNLESQMAELADRERTEIGRYEMLGADGVRLLAEVQTDVEQRRRKIVRFRFHVESRLDEVVRFMSANSKSVDERARTNDLLRSAIERHREIIHEYDYEYDEVDEALWSSLDGQWAFDDLNLD